MDKRQVRYPNIVNILPDSRPGKRIFSRSGNRSNEVSKVMQHQVDELNKIPRRSEFATLEQARLEVNPQQQYYQEQMLAQQKQQLQNQSSKANIGNIKIEEQQQQDFAPPSSELAELIEIKIQILNEMKQRYQDLKEKQMLISAEIQSQEKEINETLNEIQKLNIGTVGQTSVKPKAPLNQQFPGQSDLKSLQQRINSQQQRGQIPIYGERNASQNSKITKFGETQHLNTSNEMGQVMNPRTILSISYQLSVNTIADIRRIKQRIPESGGKINQIQFPQNALVAKRIFKGSGSHYTNTKDLLM